MAICPIPNTQRGAAAADPAPRAHGRDGTAHPCLSLPRLGTLGLCTGTLHRDLQRGFCTGAGSAWTPSATPGCLEVFGDITDTQGDVHLPVHPGHSTCETSPHPCGCVIQETKLPCPGFSSLSVHQKESEIRSKGISGEQGLHPPSAQLEMLAFPPEQS